MKNFNGEFDENNTETQNSSSKSWRSKAFYPLTEQKIMGAQAQLQDILFKGGEFPFDMKTSPIPDMGIDEPQPEPALPPSTDEQGFSVNVGPVDPALQKKAMDSAELQKRMKRMKKYVSDQLTEADASSVGLAGIFQGALYGAAFFESPKIIRKKRHFWKQKGDAFTKVEKYEDRPTVVNLDAWDCWPDPECEGHVEKGLGFFHRENMSLSDLQDLHAQVFPKKDIDDGDANTETYDYEYHKRGFDSLLKKAANGATPGPGTDQDKPTEASKTGHIAKLFEKFTFAGSVQNRFLRGLIKDLEGSDDMHTEAIVIFCNGEVIKAVANPFPGERRPYHMVPWTKIPGSCWGRGVAQKIFDPQKNVNRLTRMYIDNKRLSGNLMTAIDKSKLKRGENLEIYPGRNWEFDGGYSENDVSKLLQPIFFPDVTRGVLEAIATMVEWADQSSGIPRILEGQQGGDASTAFAENQRIMAASKQLGLVLKNFDMHAWVPIIESFYDWNMEFLKDPAVKGDYAIVATGFATFENRNIRKLDLERLLILSQQNPAVGSRVKPEPVVEDWARAGNIDPEKYLYTEDEMVARQAQKQEYQAL